MEAMSNQRYVGRRIDSFTFADGEFYVNSSFEDCTFDDVNIQGVTFNECNFNGCTFDSTTLSDTAFNDCHLRACTFYQGNILDVTFDKSCVDNCEFTDMHSFYDVHFVGGAIRKCLFKKNSQVFDVINFDSVLVMSCRFDTFLLSGCDFIKSQIRGCEFKNCLMASSDWKRSVFAWCLFDRCNIEKLIISSTNFIKSTFLDCNVDDEVKIRGKVFFIDTKLSNTNIPPLVNQDIKIASIIDDDEKARPPEAPMAPVQAPFSSLASRFKDTVSSYPNPKYIPSIFDLDDDESIHPRVLGPINYSCYSRPTKNALQAFRFFTDGI